MPADAVRDRITELRFHRSMSLRPEDLRLNTAACITYFNPLLDALEALLAERDLRTAFDQAAEAELARAVEATDAAIARLAE